MTEEGLLRIEVVYDSPADFPGKFVARGQIVTGDPANPIVIDSEPTCVADTLGEVREEMLARGLACLARQADDEPQIVECWI